MHVPEPNSLLELIDDCADIPGTLRPPMSDFPLPRRAPAWQIDDRCAEQGGDEADYGS